MHTTTKEMSSTKVIPKECFMILAGRNATEDNSVLSGHNNDLQGNNAALLELLPHTSQADENIILPSGLSIPQVSETLKCLILKTWRGYAEGDAVAINEYQVAITGGVDLGHDRNEIVKEKDPLVSRGVSGAVRYIALQQSSTAKECVKRIGDYYTTYGISYPCGVGVADTKESWYIEAGGGHSWVAVRVPDDCYMVQANGYRIGIIEPEDSDNYLCSPDLFDFCGMNGLWNYKDGAFHFAKVFGGQMTKEPRLEFFNSRRVWGAIRLLNPSLQCDPNGKDFPLFIKPENKLTVNKVMSVLRDHYGGTQFDAFPEKGCFGKDRPICVPSCVHSDVIELREWLPAEIGAILWGSLSSPGTSPYVPFYFGIKNFPVSYGEGNSYFDNRSAFWRYRALSTLALLDFSRFAPGILSTWEKEESRVFNIRDRIEKVAKHCFEVDASMAIDILTAFSYSIATRFYDRGAELAAELQTQIAESIHRVFSQPELNW
ncbi:MAG: C69 family dipeptidase [Synergistaceae bacterium]|jgi:dipeptidase|nr:C69 family dipeptidase [Synergistaceae bacterium]